MTEEVKAVKLKPLTKKQLKFVEFFTGNLTEAARQAGFAYPKVAGSKLLHIPAVKAAIEEKKAAIAAATKAAVVASGTELGTAIGTAITKDMVAQRAWEIARALPDNQGGYSSQINALKFLGELLKYTGDAQEGELRQGMIQRPDGAVEVYQSKWIKQQPSEYSPGN